MKRLIRILDLQRERTEPEKPLGTDSLDLKAELVDEISGVRIPAGSLTAIACDDPNIADEIAERLGGYSDDSSVRLGDVKFAHVSADALRQTVLVQDKDPVLLSGTLGQLFEIPNSGRVSVETALTAASADDILDSLDGDGVGAVVVERGRTLSGGQRQRLALARSLVADTPILVLDEPTSAVDAHTEARIAAAIGGIRAGLTTVMFTTSPLLLDAADHVVLVVEGRAVAAGEHHALVTGNQEYRAVVVRDGS
jgi:ABC-type multidrug transport system fused ATPase/permease subunit